MTKKPINEVVILYNPNSTGDSFKNAQKLKNSLKKAGYKHTVSLVGTQHKNHAEEIAQQYGATTARVFLVSSSGDGGYHELINGLVSTDNKTVVAGLLPSGNANDHFHAQSGMDVVQSVMHNETKFVDVLEVRAKINGKRWTRYAHSYVGLGISPAIGSELNHYELNPVNEKVLLAKKLFQFKRVKIILNGKPQKITSLVCANIPRMSKVLKIGQNKPADDGKFEVTIVGARSRLRIIAALFKAISVGLQEIESTTSFSFKTVSKVSIQLDGEVYDIDPHTKVRITSLQKRLETII